MVQATQYLLTHKELVTAIVKNLGIHEGVWMLTVNFNFAVTNLGPEGHDVLPSVISSVNKIGISLATPDTPSNLVVDAAEVNPAS